MIADEESAQAWLATLPEYDGPAGRQLRVLAELLALENQQQNLVAASSLPHIWQRHIADSAQLLCHVPRETAGTWLDLGTGAGFPGLVIAILRPDTPIVLVESRARRAAWLGRVCGALGLHNARVVASPLEQLPSEPMAVISARAFAPLGRLLDLSARFSTAGTLWLLPKGRSAAHELHRLQGWRHTFHVEQSLTDPAAGVIVGHLVGKAEQ